MNGVERGCLILADISGYTEYLTGVELEHSTDILADLINTIVEQMRGTFLLAKLEGDAIFAHAPDSGGPEGISLVTAVEGCYFAFVQRQATIDRATTCECDACRRIPTLNLKFVVHYGSYAVHEVAGSSELVGSDVIVAHRLLKNEIAGVTGLRGYAFFSGNCTERYGLDPMALTLRPHTETYEDVGEISGWVLDLEGRWREEQERRVVKVARDDPTAIVLEFDMPAPPPVLWEHLTSPAKRLVWQEGTTDFRQQNPRGARGVGTVNHCVHGRSTIYEEVVDWKPYRYMTDRVMMPKPMGPFLSTMELSPIADGERTRLVILLRPEGGLGQKLLMRAMGKKMKAEFTGGMTKLAEILRNEVREPATSSG